MARAYGIEEELRRVAAPAARRVPGPVDAEAVALAGPDAGDVAVPAEGGALGEVGAALAARLVEEAELDPHGD